MTYPKRIALYFFVCLVALTRALIMPFVLPLRSTGYRDNYYLAEDQAWNAVINGKPDETISARAHRSGSRWERFINWLFGDEFHCAKAYLSEMNDTQNAKEYHRG